MTPSSVEPRSWTPQKFAGLAALGVGGAVAGYFVGQMLSGQNIAWEDELALIVAALLMATAVASVVVMATRPASTPKGCGVLQITVFVLAAVMLALPVLAPTAIAPGTVFLGLVLLLAVQSAANLMLWRRADEMLRQVMLDTSALAFWVLQSALFLYAAAERLGLIQTITGWGLMGILMVVYLFASVAASARRGIT